MAGTLGIGNLRVGRYAAWGDGIHDDTAAIQGALADATSGDTILFPAGTYLVTGTLSLANSRTRLLGEGSQTQIRGGATLPNGIINVSGNQCTIESLMIAGGGAAPASGNPAADAIVISGGAVGTRILNVAQFYVNGWSVNFLATATGYGVMIDNCYFRQCLNGVTFDGSSATGFSPSVMIANTFVDTVATGDCVYLHNCHDFNAASLLLSSSSTTGFGIHLKGTCQAVQIDSSDIFLPSTNAGQWGMYTEPDGGNIPGLITVNATIMAGGDFCYASTNGQGVVFNGCLFTLARQGSVYIAGGSSGDAYSFVGCVSKANNVGNLGNGEFNVQTTSPVVRVSNHTLLAGTNAISPLTAIANANLQIRNSGLSAAVSTPGFPLTTVAVRNTTALDVMAYIVNGTSALTVQVDSVTGLMIIPASQTGSVLIPANSTFTPTYGGGAPTWKWYGLQ
jgi:Pectate lyase superfamily protein